jgi:hypothetical protein
MRHPDKLALRVGLRRLTLGETAGCEGRDGTLRAGVVPVGLTHRPAFCRLCAEENVRKG